MKRLRVTPSMPLDAIALSNRRFVVTMIIFLNAFFDRGYASRALVPNELHHT